MSNQSRACAVTSARTVPAISHNPTNISGSQIFPVSGTRRTTCEGTGLQRLM